MKPSQPTPWSALAEPALVAIALVILIAAAGGGPGWTDAAHQAALATQLERTASAPLYGVLAGIAAHVPVGEPGFRLGLLGAALGALTLLGVIRAARALLPKDPVAAALPPLLLVLAPPFRDAAAVAEPALLAACGAAWSVAFAAQARAGHRAAAATPRAIAAVAAIAVVVGAAPYLGVALGLLIVPWIARTVPRAALALALAAVGALVVVLWIGALGRLPAIAPDLHALVASSGRGAAAVVVGAGLLGAGFGAVTGLPAARPLALAIAVAAAVTIVVPQPPLAVLALLAIGAAVIPGAVVRALPRQRHLVAAAAIAPLMLAALLAGPAFTIDDGEDAPARLATDLTAALPAGPGVFVTTRPTTFAALEYAQLVAGARPDLRLVPPLPAETVDVIVKNALVSNRIAGADTFTPGLHLEPRWSMPRGRSFQLLAGVPVTLAAIRPPARYASAIGAAEAVTLALGLASYETVFGRFDAAAHAAGLRDRFGAADLALLATSAPVHRTLLDYLPDFGTPAGPWLLELLGDDLAWRVGIAVPAVDGPPARQLHALWRKLIAGEIDADDPAIAALGPRAVAATARLVEQPAP